MPQSRNYSLPSHNYAADFLVSPNARTSGKLLGSYIGRAAILSAGYLLTQNDLRSSVRFALIGSAAIEAYVLFEVSSMLRERRRS